MSVLKYIIGNELTDRAHLTKDLIKKCTFNVGATIPVKINEDEVGRKRMMRREYYQHFVEVAYASGEKSASMVVPDCVTHHSVHDYFGKSAIYVGILQLFVREIQLKLSSSGHSPIFQDRHTLSDSEYWWTRTALVEVKENEEYIRIILEDEKGEEVEDSYGSFAELFRDYPTSMKANITCSMKLKADTPEGQDLKGNEE